MSTTTTLTAFHSFGFTYTESAAYLQLLSEGAATGYAVARETGLARANVYAALEDLARRGIVTREQGKPTRYHALPPDACVALLAAAQREALSRLEAELARFHMPSQDTVRYFDTTHTARTLAERLATRARERLVGEVTESAVKLLSPLVRRLRARGVTVKLGTTAQDSQLAHLLVDRRWALLWLSEGRGMWGGDPLLIAIASRLSGLEPP